MEQDSCRSDSSRQSSNFEDDEDDSAFAKTPIRADSAELDDDDESSSESSNASEHMNDQGDKTYFHVWSDMLTCTEMAVLDKQAEDEEPEYAEGDEPPGNFKPLHIDTSLPCPLIQFGPVPKRRPVKKPVEAGAAAAAAAVATAAPEALAGDARSTESEVEAEASAEPAQAAAAASGGCAHGVHTAASGSDRCCDFSVVAAKNKARLREQERLRRREQRKLVRY